MIKILILDRKMNKLSTDNLTALNKEIVETCDARIFTKDRIQKQEKTRILNLLM